MAGILKNDQSYKLGDIDGDGNNEIVYLDTDNKIKAIKVAPDMNGSVFNRLRSTNWKLINHQYGDDYELRFDSKGKAVTFGSGYKEDLIVSPYVPNAIVTTQHASMASITIKGVTDTKMWGTIWDVRADERDGRNPGEIKFEAIRVR